MINSNKKLSLAIIGLGYVGLPLALEFAKKRSVIGFDINKKRIKELYFGLDRNKEFKKKDLKNSKLLKLSSNEKDLKSANCYIITVPTPVDKSKKPNLKPLLKASRMVGRLIDKGDLVIYESTVYPGCIDEECVPILKRFSNLNYNKDFYCGYSPERINPGDKDHTISNIKKITSGSTLKIANIVDDLYNEIITVGTHKASSIKVAEAAKVIENTQRDLNIGLINELSILFSKMNIDTKEVLDAAGSKWNFLPFKPGLVGGHCIGVDPYYLTHKAKQIGYNPKIILASRKLNDNMGKYVTSRLINALKKKNIKIKGSKILIMGLSFKENCADTRNSGILSVITTLKKLNCKLDLYDPWVNKKDIKEIYNIFPQTKLNQNTYDAVIIAVAHDKFKKMGAKAISNLCKKSHIIYDLKYLFLKNQTDLRM
ncbi:Vi polysaccharide biosynthesis UDP-N-acetylglucosamine C-6 dehydrogenase TviB [Candidatus Pelagibacter bacterium nBUS_28]|jgi:UDP-N-acetyl-D-galactosamine dehydrogenase|uniref:Vi polysaccharide biosynthesis UDP-N-acetylglucosamine C-6 dehydrogenase TviB n=1 Tax=Candidatus Pelagibacter bacterium nBUS_28 TaxID=3374189 RepID=UPI003EB79489